MIATNKKGQKVEAADLAVVASGPAALAFGYRPFAQRVRFAPTRITASAGPAFVTASARTLFLVVWKQKASLRASKHALRMRIVKPLARAERRFLVKLILLGSANVNFVSVLPVALLTKRVPFAKTVKEALPPFFSAHGALHRHGLGLSLKAVVKAVYASKADHLLPDEEVVAPMHAPGRWEAVRRGAVA